MCMCAQEGAQLMCRHVRSLNQDNIVKLHFTGPTQHCTYRTRIPKAINKLKKYDRLGIISTKKERKKNPSKENTHTQAEGFELLTYQRDARVPVNQDWVKSISLNASSVTSIFPKQPPGLMNLTTNLLLKSCHNRQQRVNWIPLISSKKRNLQLVILMQQPQFKASHANSHSRSTPFCPIYLMQLTLP